MCYFFYKNNIRITMSSLVAFGAKKNFLFSCAPKVEAFWNKHKVTILIIGTGLAGAGIFSALAFSGGGVAFLAVMAMPLKAGLISLVATGILASGGIYEVYQWHKNAKSLSSTTAIVSSHHLPITPVCKQTRWLTKRRVITGACLVLGLGALAYLGYRYGWFSSFFGNKTPTSQASAISPSPEIPQASAFAQGSGSSQLSSLCSKKISVFTSYTTDNSERLAMSRKVAENQRLYCAQQGCCYEAVEKNLAPDVLPYWSKVSGIRQRLNEKGPEWIVWMDDDALVANTKINLDKFIQTHGGSNPNTHVIVTHDMPFASTDINTGVLMVRNSPESRQFFDALWQKRNLQTIRTPQYTYGACPNQICLHEQEAMHDLMKEQPQLQKLVNVIPQRGEDGIGINTFHRFDHYDIDRQMNLNYYYNDPWKSTFQSGDFITQCTGLAMRGVRKLGDIPRNLRMDCIIDTLNRVL
jgi:hypothetical protein